MTKSVAVQKVRASLSRTRRALDADGEALEQFKLLVVIKPREMLDLTTLWKSFVKEQSNLEPRVKGPTMGDLDGCRLGHSRQSNWPKL